MPDRTVLVALGLLLVLLAGLQLGFGVRLPWWAPIPVYLVLYAVASAALAGIRVRRHAAPGAESDGAVSREDVPGAPRTTPSALAGGRRVAVEEWPTSGPIGRFGQRGLILAFGLTGTLSLLNPFQLVEIVRQGVGNVGIRRRLGADPPMPGSRQPRTRYTLPVRPPADGRLSWFVYNGGVTEADSHSWEVLTQRFAHDFVVVDDRLRRHRGRGTDPADYFCHGLDIVAAADGVVVEVEQAIGTAPLVGWGVADFLARSFRGNYVVLRHAEDEFGVHAHLAPGSVVVTEGAEVRRGQSIGCCGHTGHSSEPHLHFHLQDRADFFTGAGLPVRFHDLVVDGRVVEAAWLRPGHRVAPLRKAEEGP